MISRRFKKLITTLVVLFCTSTASLPSHAGELNCKKFAGIYMGWAKSKLGVARIGAKMATVKIRETHPEKYPWGHGSYAEGGLGLSGDHLEGRFFTLFSDRKAAGGKYRFDPDKKDIIDVQLYPNQVRLLLRSWGDTAIVLDDVKCYNEGFLTGIAREGNGESMVSIALRKELIPKANDPFRDWP